MNDTPQERLRKALEASKTFEQGVMGKILARDAQGNWIVPNSAVPAYFFHTGATSADDIRALLKAGGDIHLLEGYAGSVLRNSGIIKADGSVDIDALDGWIASHAVALTAMPAFNEKLANIQQTQYELRLAKYVIQEALDDFNSKPGALFVHNAPMTAVEKLFALPFPVEGMRELLVQIGANGAHLDSLRKAVIDYLTDRVGVEIERHPSFCQFLDRHREELYMLFGADKFRTLESIAADLLRQAAAEDVSKVEATRERIALKRKKTGTCTIAMKYPTRGFKNLQVGLKELEPFIRDGEHLQTGRPFKALGGMLSREVLANWLICVAYNFASQADRLMFTSDPLGGDGIFCNSETEETFPTEHVMVPRARAGEAGDAEAMILKAIGNKQSKGATYASGKTLVVFLNGSGGKWFPNKVCKQLPEPLYFEAVWVVGTHGMEEGRYVYSVTSLELSEGNAPTWLVRIGKNFDAWEVNPVQ